MNDESIKKLLDIPGDTGGEEQRRSNSTGAMPHPGHSTLHFHTPTMPPPESIGVGGRYSSRDLDFYFGVLGSFWDAVVYFEEIRGSRAQVFVPSVFQINMMLLVNDDTEILSRLGVLAPCLEDHSKCLRNERMFSGFVFPESKAGGNYSSVDDEISSNVYLKGISTSVQNITLPNIVVSTHASDFLFIVFVFCIATCGFLLGCSTALLGSSKDVLSAYVYSFLTGFLHGTIFRGGLIILCANNFGTRTVFAMHVFFAAGILLMSVLSTFILSGVAVPYPYSNKLSGDYNVMDQLPIKQEVHSSLLQSRKDIFTEPTILKNFVTSKISRPDHVVGVDSVAEPKTQGNLEKQKVTVERTKSEMEGQSVLPKESSFLSSVSPGYVNISSIASLHHLEKDDKGTARNTKGTETTTRSDALFTLHSLKKSNNFTASFVFSDISYSFSELNWQIDSVTFPSLWVLKDLEQKFGPFQNIHVVYALATFLGFCNLLLYFFTAVYYDSFYITEPSMRITELQTTPNLFADCKEMAVSWRVYSVLFFLLTGGVELVVGEGLIFYALFRPELNLSQRNGLFLTSIFWCGVIAARISFIVMTKFVNISRLSNVVLFSAVVAGYVAASVRSFLAALFILFILGLSLGPLSPSLFCWLDEQKLSSRLSLTLLYVIVLVSVISQFPNGPSPEMNSSATDKKMRNGDYMALVDGSNSKYEIFADDGSSSEGLDR
uniref:Uncharacterized protein n=1 Tax=Setaria digitata TaxID=48799 RepID=A0A915PJT8_9BILA